jgi:hypothetical protein
MVHDKAMPGSGMAFFNSAVIASLVSFIIHTLLTLDFRSGMMYLAPAVLFIRHHYG